MRSIVLQGSHYTCKLLALVPAPTTPDQASSLRCWLFQSIARPAHLGLEAICVWFDVEPWIRGPLFTPNGFVGDAISDYFGTNKWCRTYVFGNNNHFLLVISSQVASFQCNFVLSFNWVLLWNQSWRADESNVWGRSNSFCLWETRRSDIRESIWGLFTPFLGGWTYSETDRMPHGVKKHP